jgi:peptidoglycan/xylan/chitin deacetylase (PgdA/CDA1 family)
MAVPLRRITLGALICLVVWTGSAATVWGAHAPRRAFVPVLIYHHVKWLKPSDDAIERGLTVLPSQFGAQLDFLASAGYHAVTAAEVVAYLRGGKRLAEHPVALTFDDGYSDVFHNVFPQLTRRRMHATFFIVPGFLDRPRYLTWVQVETMAAHGMDIEAHSLTHPDLTTVSPTQLRGEVRGSRRVLEARLRRSVRVFAYPYGAYDYQVRAALIDAGFYASFTTNEGWWQTTKDLYILPRVYVDIDDTLEIFKGRLVADPSILARDPT